MLAIENNYVITRPEPEGYMSLKTTACEKGGSSTRGANVEIGGPPHDLTTIKERERGPRRITESEAENRLVMRRAKATQWSSWCKAPVTSHSRVLRVSTPAGRLPLVERRIECDFE